MDNSGNDTAVAHDRVFPSGDDIDLHCRPGRWRYTKQHEQVSSTAVEIWDGGAESLWEMEIWGEPSWDAVHAMGYMTAAAPDLYHALAWVMNSIATNGTALYEPESWELAKDAAFAALDKARGGGLCEDCGRREGDEDCVCREGDRVE